MELIRSTWKQKGVSICSDGWADTKKRPIINFIVVTGSGPISLNSVNAEREVKNMYYIAEKLEDCIKEVGAQNIIQIITDNTFACNAAGVIVESKYPYIFWTPCILHTFNLALKTICADKNTETNVVAYAQCSWITKVSNDALIIFFYHEPFHEVAMFNDETFCGCRN